MDGVKVVTFCFAFSNTKIDIKNFFLVETSYRDINELSCYHLSTLLPLVLRTKVSRLNFLSFSGKRTTGVTQTGMSGENRLLRLS